MALTSDDLSLQLRSLSRTLQQLHAHVLQSERELDPALAGLLGMDRLTNDPSLAWLRLVSSLIADVDRVLASNAPVTPAEGATVAAHVRGVIFGLGEYINEEFLSRYRPLLQLSPALASTHGELKRLVDALPTESENESERLHARHLWAERCRQRVPRRQ